MSNTPSGDARKEPMTVVVPVKDRATLVLRTLASIKAQSWRPLKVIVVDNNSTDGTPDSVKGWMERNAAEDFEVTLVSEERPGPAAARNRGLEDVDTRLMMFFDSDDLMQPGHIESVMKRFHAGDDPDMVCFRVTYHNINGADRITHGGAGDMMFAHLCHSLLRTQGYACETALARRAGGWDNDLHCWEDLEFGARVLMEARRRAYIGDVNVEVYARADSVTGTEFSSRMGDWEKALDKLDVTFEKSRQRKRDKWRRLIAYRRVILAAAYRKEGNSAGAERLLARALDNPLLGKLQRAFLRLVYHYTAAGGRGSAPLAKIIL